MLDVMLLLTVEGGDYILQVYFVLPYFVSFFEYFDVVAFAGVEVFLYFEVYPFHQFF